MIELAVTLQAFASCPSGCVVNVAKHGMLYFELIFLVVRLLRSALRARIEGGLVGPAWLLAELVAGASPKMGNTTCNGSGCHCDRKPPTQNILVDASETAQAPPLEAVHRRQRASAVHEAKDAGLKADAE